MLNDSEFDQLIEETLLSIEEAIETCEVDIDYETHGGVLTLSFENDSKIIINGQKAAHQLWIAAKSGGFHLDYDRQLQTWKTDTAQGEQAAGEPLNSLLTRLCSQQAEQPVSF